MAKTIAEEIRQTMDRLAEASRQNYDLEITVENWEDSDDDSALDRTLGINYRISGKYRPATWGERGGEPEEHPELDEYQVFDADTGQEITSVLPDDVEQQIVNAIWQDAARDKGDYDEYDLDSRRY